MKKRPLKPALARVEAALIKSALRSTGGRVERAAAILDVSSRTLWRRLREHGIDHKAYLGARTSVQYDKPVTL